MVVEAAAAAAAAAPDVDSVAVPRRHVGLGGCLSRDAVVLAPQSSGVGDHGDGHRLSMPSHAQAAAAGQLVVGQAPPMKRMWRQWSKVKAAQGAA